MTLPVQNPSQIIAAVEGQTAFPFVFRCDDSTLIHVWSNDAELGGVVTALNADQIASPGGTVTLPAASFGDIITIERVSPTTQTLAMTAYNPFTAVALMAALDRMVMLLQEFCAWLSRGLVASRMNYSRMTTMNIPPPAPGYALGWVADGAGFKLTNTTLASISGGNVAGRTLVKNEVPVGVVNNVNDTFTLAHSPFSGAYMDVYVAGLRYPPARYALAVNAIIFVAGYIPPFGAEIYVDYYW